MGKPKRPLSAYLFFSNEVRERTRAQNPGVKPTEISKIIGDNWTAMSSENKKIYEQKYAKAKIEYEIELEKWKVTIATLAKQGKL